MGGSHTSQETIALVHGTPAKSPNRDTRKRRG